MLVAAGDHVYLWSLDDLAHGRPVSSQQIAAAQQASRRGKRSRQEEHCLATAGDEAGDGYQGGKSQPQAHGQVVNGPQAPTAVPQASASAGGLLQAVGSRPSVSPSTLTGSGSGHDDADTAATDAGCADAGRPASRVLSVAAALELLEVGDTRVCCVTRLADDEPGTPEA